MRLIGRELLIAALVAVVGAQDVSRTSVTDVCPAGLLGTFYVRNQSCYQFVDEEENWEKARAYCHEKDGRLVSITDADLQAWLSNTAAQLWQGKNGVWIGLNDRSTSGLFLWDDYGTNAEHQISYSNWANGSPKNKLHSGNCVHMRRDEDWQWLERACNFVVGFIYNYICEYRIAATLNANATSPSGPVNTSAAQVTLHSESLTPDTQSVGSLTPEAKHWFTSYYPLAVVSSSASNDATHDSVRTSPSYFGTVASGGDVTAPLAVSLTAVAVVAALITLAVVLKRRQQRSRLLKGSTVSWTRSDDDESTMVDNPMYGDATQIAVDQATAFYGADSDGLPGKPVTNINAEARNAVSVVRSQEDFADGCLSDLDAGEIYSEPFMQGTSAAITSETQTQYQQHTYVNASSFLLQPGMDVHEAASTDCSQPGKQ